MFIAILKAVLVLGALGLIFGVVLAYAGKVFEMKKDEKFELINEALPGANCGACGYAGCAAYADAIYNKGEKANLCSAGGDKVAARLAEIMGNEPETTEKLRAAVMCSGTSENIEKKYNYKGINDCGTASRLGGGEKECSYGCVGLGTCLNSCKFDAIKIKNGIAVVDNDKCTACGMCVAACPKGIIKLIPLDSTHWVRCASEDKGAAIRKYCKAGCIACGICEKSCPANAILVKNNIAEIDYTKCNGCGICVEKCPTKTIIGTEAKPEIQE